MKASRWHKLRSLSFSEVCFLVEAAATVVGFDLAFRLFSSKTCLALLGRKQSSQGGQQGAGQILMPSANRRTRVAVAPSGCRDEPADRCRAARGEIHGSQLA
jgi:hypothetical protein